MNNYIFLIVLAISGGIAVALQAHFMGLMNKHIGTLESVFITYFSGGLAISLFMIVMRGGGALGNLQVWQSIPWYTLSAGLIGLFIVGTIGYTTSQLGLATAFTLILAAQFGTSILIDHFGWLGANVHLLTPTRLLGLGVLFLGVWLIIR